MDTHCVPRTLPHNTAHHHYWWEIERRNEVSTPRVFKAGDVWSMRLFSLTAPYNHRRHYIVTHANEGEEPIVITATCTGRRVDSWNLNPFRLTEQMCYSIKFTINIKTLKGRLWLYILFPKHKDIVQVQRIIHKGEITP
jgi:hypothetical protein